MSRIPYLAIALIWLAFQAVGTGCAKKPPAKTKEQVMQEKLGERLERWHIEVAKNCDKKVIERAAAIVDSTLLADARYKRDISDLPPIPGRPSKPVYVPPKDSLPVKPLIKAPEDSIN